MPQMSHVFINYSTGLPPFAVEDNNAVDSQQKSFLEKGKETKFSAKDITPKLLVMHEFIELEPADQMSV